MAQHDVYENPLITRYASSAMARIFGDQSRFSTWRRLWVALAVAEQELGLDISDDQIAQMRAHVDNIDFQQAAMFERKLRHDVMAHVHTFGLAAPAAMPIIHLGATSCYITDNTDLILMRQAMQLIRRRLVTAIMRLGQVAAQHRALPCLGYTHFQPAQPTTVGKRICLWIYDLVLDLEELQFRLSQLKCRSIKGTTGTQASFLALFDGDHEKVRRLEQRVAKEIGFEEVYAVTGQTYTRKVDAQILDCLSGVAQSVHKIATDIRLLANRKEIEEPFEKDQIGSSAMAYKRNPMRSERMCSLARYVMSLPTNLAQTVATQWLERTLDDSANRRIVIPQGFLAVDAILSLLINVADGLVVYPKVIDKNLRAELPMMATENIMMAAVKAGGDRQHLHEQIRLHSMAAGARIKLEGLDNDLLDRIKLDPTFADIDIDSMLDPIKFVGRAPEQVDEFLQQHVQPLTLAFANEMLAGDEAEIKV
ncbi:MAG: adenylosuccinate lyase [Planctomycetaceae bacterium]|nr:adenylosuccinate lyase [Planctomycetaceae bacterium]